MFVCLYVCQHSKMFFVIEERTWYNGQVSTHVHSEHEYLVQAIHYLHVQQLVLAINVFTSRDHKYLLHAYETYKTSIIELHGDEYITKCSIVRYETVRAAIESRPFWKKTITMNDLLDFNFVQTSKANIMQQYLISLVKIAINTAQNTDFDLSQYHFESHLSEMFKDTSHIQHALPL